MTRTYCVARTDSPIPEIAQRRPWAVFARYENDPEWEDGVTRLQTFVTKGGAENAAAEMQRQREINDEKAHPALTPRTAQPRGKADAHGQDRRRTIHAGCNRPTHRGKSQLNAKTASRG